LKFKVPQFVALVASSVLVSCASMVSNTKYSTFYGPESFQGTGGTKHTVDGVDIWDNGTPYGKFKILGIINDNVFENTGAEPNTLNVLAVASAVALARREHRLVVEAMNHGGDALVCLSANRSFLNTTIYQTNFRNDVAVLVLKYLPEAAPPATANSPTK
jgi:hypothetical protein